MRTRSLLSLATIPFALIALIACSERQMVSYTFTKPNMTQQALLDDEQQLKKTSGVSQVSAKIDDKNTVRINVVFDEAKKAAGMKYILDMGYSESRN